MIKYVFLSIFIVIMIGIGIYSRKKVNDIQDFFLGGRKMGAWISAFAYGTSYFSAVIFIGYAGSIGWSFGISAIWIGIGNAIIGSLLAWIVLGRRTRQMTHEMNASTMPEFLEKRYDSKNLKIVTAIITFVFLVPYSASVYKGLGYLFTNTFGMPIEYYTYCMLSMAVLTGIYLLLGGYIATAINDFIQGIVMIFGIILMLYFVLSHPAVGGISAGLGKLSSIPDVGNNLVSPVSGMPWNLISLVILTSLGTWGLPQMVHKFYAIESEKAIKKATIITTAFASIIGIGAYLTGSFGRLFLNNVQPADMDMVMPLLLEEALPDALMGIIIILVLSASMSTLSSLVLVSSSSIALDLFKGTLFPEMKKEKEMFIMRFLCALFIALSYIVAVTPNAIVTLMSFSWGTVAGSFLAPFIYGLYWKGTTKIGAWAGLLSGFCCSIGGAFYYGMNAKMAPNIGTVAMLVSLVIVPVVSLVTAKLPETHLEKVFPTVKKEVVGLQAEEV
ncbi:MAG: sodium:solute symporter family transporter [Halanaerobiaceae bacterium]